jgi:hypothetical protein
MREAIRLNLAFEDSLQEAVLKKIISQLERSFSIGKCFSQGGFGYLKKNMKGFNHAAKETPFLVLTDLDRSECPLILINEWLSFPKHPNLLFRIAVREVEAWILAHRTSMASYLGITPNKIPLPVEEIPDPKQLLINLARKSRYRVLREAIVPKEGSSAQQGPDYNGKLIHFVINSWDSKIAASNSPSLKRTIEVLSLFNPV